MDWSSDLCSSDLLDVGRLGAFARRHEPREIAARRLLVVIGEELVADRLELADEQAKGRAVLRDGAVAIDDDHLPAQAQRRAQPPEEGVGLADLVKHRDNEKEVGEDFWKPQIGRGTCREEGGKKGKIWWVA